MTKQHDGSVNVNGNRLGLPQWTTVRVPKTEAQKLGVLAPKDQSAEGGSDSPARVSTEYVGVMRDGQLKLVPKGRVTPQAKSGVSPVVDAIQSLGVSVIDVDAQKGVAKGDVVGDGYAPSETISLSLPRLYMDALKWLAKSEGQSVAEWLYHSARRGVPQNLWGALIQGRPEDELQALKVSGGKVSLRPPPSPSEQIELDKMDDKQRLYLQLVTFPHDTHHPCGHCRKGNLGGRSAGDTRVCANMQYTLGAPCHWPAQALRNGGGCPGFQPKR